MAVPIERAHLVLDCSAIRQDLTLVGQAAETCLFAARAGTVDVCFPEVVVLELARRYREAVESGYAALKKAQEALERLTGHKAGGTYEILMDFGVVQDQEKQLRERILRNGARILPLPKVGHERVLSRDLRRKRPFDENGRGYRDALIWESILELASATKAPILFVTENVKDFAAPDRKAERQPEIRLHPHLVKDLERRDLPPTSVVLVDDLTRALADHVNLQPDDRIVGRFTADRDARIGLATAVMERKESLRGRHVERGAPSVTPLEIYDVLCVLDLAVTAARSLDEGRKMVLSRVTIEASLVEVSRGHDEESVVDEFGRFLRQAAKGLRGRQYVDVTLAYFLDEHDQVLDIYAGSISVNHERNPLLGADEKLA